jgi:hypothetical protein
MTQLSDEIVAAIRIAVRDEVATAIRDQVRDLVNADGTKLHDDIDNYLTSKVLARIGQLETVVTHIQSEGIKVTPTAPAPTPRSTLKSAPPPDFDGERARARAFLNACLLSFRTVPEDFPTDEKKIGWVLSYMKSGRALSFQQRAVEYYSTSSAYEWSSWSNFEKAFREEFFPINEVEDALLALEGTSYYQGKRAMDVYIDEFQVLVDRAQMKDVASRVVKFRRGMNQDIQQAIQTSQNPPRDFEEWKTQARTQAKARQQANDFRGAISTHSRSVPIAPAPLRQAFGDFVRNRSTPAPPVQVLTPTLPPQKMPQPSLPPGIPMDIDAARRAKPQAKLFACRRCGAPDHFVRDCPQSFDIRAMDSEEIAQYLALQKDEEILAIVAQQSAESATPIADSAAPESSEGFAEHSG